MAKKRKTTGQAKPRTKKPEAAEKKPSAKRKTSKRKAAEKKPSAKRKTSKRKAPAKSAKRKPKPKADPPQPRPVRPTRPTRPTRGRKVTSRSHRQAAAERSRQISAKEREIGPIPPVVDPERRAACEADTTLALRTYFPAAFPLPFSSQHLEVIATMRLVFKDGGLFALGMPRGSGKTTIVIRCALLAMLYGWRRFLIFIGAVQSHASAMLADFKSEIETNDTLLQDFPEFCFPVRALEYTPSRARGQTTDGKHTLAKWDGDKRVVLPTVNGQGGGIIGAVGVNNSNIRGTKARLPDGTILRPDAFAADDLQTAATARSVEQVNKLEHIVNADVLGMAGPGKTIAGVATITVQRQGDLAARLLDQVNNPIWQGKRFALVEKWPTNQRLWAEYAERRDVDLANKKPHLPSATEFYRRNRKAMDAGAKVPWKERFLPTELSAVQSAYNLKLYDPHTFDAEYQNDPADAITAEGQIAAPDSDSIVRRIGGYARGEVPSDATQLFAGVDVQQDALFWMVAAVADDLTGYVVDYGAWPEQPLLYWTLRQVHTSISDETGIASLEGSLAAAFSAFLPALAAKEYKRDDGAVMRCDRVVVDANWGKSTKSVYSWIRQARSNTFLPFHGRGITAKQSPIAARKRKPGEQAGVEWFVPKVKGTREVRHVIADTNLVKTTLGERLMQPIGEPGAWQLFHAPAASHRMLADHLSAEYPVETSGRGRTLIEWIPRPGRDNHWLDCAVMILTAALMSGCAAPGTAAATRPRPKRRRELRDLGDAMRDAG